MWKAKQRVLSRTEPELGCGIVQETANSWLEVFFPLRNELRRYGSKGAPIQRYILSEGQTFFPASGEPFEVSTVIENDHILTYVDSDGVEHGEWLMDHQTHDQGTLEQLYGGHFSDHKTYELRREAWGIRAEFYGSPVSGLIGPRVQPIPHQLYIASEVISRPTPRVLLADEVGLGKTIEAGLIISGLRQRGRADRVLIVVPEALVFQWVHEMFRRFNLLFSVLDESRIQDEENEDGISAFSSNQLCIVAMDWLIKSPKTVQKIQQNTFNLVVMDEAHHIRWDYEEPSPKWLVAKTISEFCEGLLLLTATPRQYGFDTQFGLLNLVDPVRYSDFDQFVEEADFAREVAHVSKALYETNTIEKETKDALTKLFGFDKELQKTLASPDSNASDALSALIDRHGTGRVLFRNRRAKISGFPKRNILAFPLKGSPDYYSTLQSLDSTIDNLTLMDFATGRTSERGTLESSETDMRLKFISSYIKKNLHGDKKALIICSTVDSVLRLANYIEEYSQIKVAIFHEKLSVIERDQEAAMFADDPQCKILVSSEIGGEGRNFQFADTLIMGDIPRHPDLVEQRIGRLDRIGQKNDVTVVIPYFENSLEEILFTWYDSGLSSFTASWNGTDVFLSEFADDLFSVMRCHLNDSSDLQKNELLTKLVNETQKHADFIRKENESSVDLLMDLNSFKKEVGDGLMEAVEAADDNPDLEFFIRSMFEHYGVDYDEYDDRGTLLVKADSMKFIEKFPGIDNEENTLVTFDRDVALLREDITFATGDHPIAEGALSLLLDRNEGAASMAKWLDSPYDRGLIIEFSFVFEPSGSKYLELGRFLPIYTKELQFRHDSTFINEKRHKKNPSVLSALTYDDQQPNPERLKDIIEPIANHAKKQIDEWAHDKTLKALKKAKSYFSQEISRLSYLSKVNRSVSQNDLSKFRERYEQSMACIEKSKPRLDSVRLIFTS